MKLRNFLDKHYVIGTILLLIIATLLVYIMPVFALGNMTIGSFLIVPGAIIALLIFKRIFKGEFQGFIKGGDSKTGIRLAAIMLIYYAFLVCQMLVCGEFASPTMQTVAIACAAGCGEETIFRGCLISFLLKHKNTKKAIPWILVASALLFGGFHLINTLGGAGIGITIIQIIGATGMGALFAAIYMRSGNLLIIMIAHGLTDLIGFMDSAQTSQEGLMIAQVSFTNYVDATICVGLFVIALYLIRPSKRDEIVAMWNKKWNKA